MAESIVDDYMVNKLASALGRGVPTTLMLDNITSEMLTQAHDEVVKAIRKLDETLGDGLDRLSEAQERANEYTLLDLLLRHGSAGAVKWAQDQAIELGRQLRDGAS